MNVQELLEQKDVHFIQKGKDFVVRCLNPEHEDRNPSMRIDQIDGRFNCFSCGYKGSIFVHFGEKASMMQMKREVVKRKIQEKRAENVGLPFPTHYMPYVGNWRNISPRTYKKFEAFEHTGKDYISRINFPIRDISGKIVAFQGRHTAGGEPKYKFTPPGAKLPLFPQVSARLGEIILVEGIYDVINLHDKGLTNAVCCFGVKNVSVEKLQVLAVQGIERIDIFLDNDEAGQKGSEIIKQLCEEAELSTRNIAFGNKYMDAGSLSQSQVDKLKDKLYG